MSATCPRNGPPLTEQTAIIFLNNILLILAVCMRLVSLQAGTSGNNLPRDLKDKHRQELVARSTRRSFSEFKCLFFSVYEATQSMPNRCVSLVLGQPAAARYLPAWGSVDAF